MLVGDGVLWWVMVRSGRAAMEARRAPQREGRAGGRWCALMGDGAPWTGCGGG